MWSLSGPTAALLDGILKAAASMIGGVPKFRHISEFKWDTLHWLAVRQCIHHRLSSVLGQNGSGQNGTDKMLPVIAKSVTCS